MSIDYSSVTRGPLPKGLRGVYAGLLLDAGKPRNAWLVGTCVCGSCRCLYYVGGAGVY